MYVSAAESRVLSRIFGLLAEDLGEHDVREAVGQHLLELGVHLGLALVLLDAHDDRPADLALARDSRSNMTPAARRTRRSETTIFAAAASARACDA